MSAPIFVPGVNVIGVTLLFERDDAPEAEKARGNHAWVPATEIICPDRPPGDPSPLAGELDHCIPVVDAPLAQTLARGTVSTQSGSVFVPRDSGVADNMRFLYQGTWFGIVGDERWNYNHALTGEDFGYVEFTVRKGG